MAKISDKISIDVEEIKKNLTTQALNAKTHLTELASKAQKDLEEREVYKKVGAVIEKVKAHELTQEFLKNPKVVELKKKFTAASEQLEKTISKNAGPIIDEVKARFGTATTKATKAAKETKEAVTTTAKKAKKATASSAKED